MNDTETLTLTDFLEARIAEDEAWAASHPHFEDAPEWVPPWWTRMLAECEAKRRIVGDRAMRAFIDPDRLNGQGSRILRTLASVYADHPDYREEWRV